MDEHDSDYSRVEAAIRYIEENAGGQPSLDDVAAHIGLSPSQFQRLFTRWAGVSPKRFLQYLTVESAKKLLDESATVLDASLEVGLSGPSRLHDLFVNAEAVTPGEYKSAGESLSIRFGVGPSPFGDCLLALSPRGICSLDFLDASDGGEARSAPAALDALKNRWPGARFIPDREACVAVIESIFSGTPGNVSATGSATAPLHLRGTNFQLKVWRALLSIPEGCLVTYGKLAEMIDSPGAARAVGAALGQNPIGLLIPCHRVLRSSGAIGGYKWGLARKKALIAFEAAKRQE